MRNLKIFKQRHRTKGSRDHRGNEYTVQKLCVPPRTPQLILLLFLIAASVSAQTGTSLETEIQNLERSINRQGINPVEKHDALVRLARLRQLSGDVEGAARDWLSAAAAIPNQVDDNALLACAFCLAAMGEWDRARTALEPLLAKSARARFLSFSINAVTSGNTAQLAAIVDNPEYSQFKTEIYFLLWKLSGGQTAERWKQRLTAEFPQSPEALVASGSVSGQTVALRQSPFWLFIGGLDSLPTLPSITEGKPQTAVSTPPVTSQTQSPTTQPPQQPIVQTARLQTGIYGQQANAQAQAAKLRQAGFTPAIEERTTGNNQMWAVTVPAGADQNRTLAELREKGFDAFPLR